MTVRVTLPAPSETLVDAAEKASVPGASLSRIVSTAVFVAPSAAPPVGALSVSVTVSFGSATVSSMIGTLKVLAAPSPGPQVSVLLTGA